VRKGACEAFACHTRPLTSTLTSGTTYDQITRQTAFAAAEAVASQMPGAPMCFISAAEAGWTSDPFILPDFLKNYLVAKRAVEARLQEMGDRGQLRPIVMRPSLIWSPSRVASLPAVAAFALGNALGIPGIDKPVLVDTLARAVVHSLRTPGVSGIKGFNEMEELAAQLK